MLGGEGMKGGNPVVGGQRPARWRLALRRDRVAAGLQQQHLLAGFGQPGRHHPAAGPGADDDIVEALFGAHGVVRAA